MKSNLTGEELEFQVWGMRKGADRDEYNFLRLVDDPPDVIYDVGANVGGVSMFLAKWFPESTIVAVEPIDENYNYLVEGTKSLLNVVTRNAALCLGRAWVCKQSAGIGNWIVVGEQCNTFNPENMIPYQVATVTLDALHNEFGGDRYAVKLDCESGEMMFLQHEPSERMLLEAYYIAGEFHLWARTAEIVPDVYDRFLRWIHKLSKTHNVEMQLFGNSAKIYALRRE